MKIYKTTEFINEKLDIKPMSRSGIKSVLKTKNDQVKAIDEYMDDLWYLEETYPMCARFYNFGDGTKLYIWFKDYIYAGDEDTPLSEEHFTDDIVSLAKKYCGADKTNVKDLDYEGLPLLKLKKVADEYVNEHPFIQKALNGKTVKEIDKLYKDTKTTEFESKFVDMDEFQHIVEFNDIYNYKNGYFLKCFEEIDNMGCCRIGIVKILDNIKQSLMQFSQKNN